jgi:hypothetical protein
MAHGISPLATEPTVRSYKLQTANDKNAGAARHFLTIFYALGLGPSYKVAISLEKYKEVIKFLMAATAGCQGTKNRVFASESAQTHHARTTTHYWHHTDQCYSLGVH